MSAPVLALIVEREAQKISKLSALEEQLSLPDLERVEILSRCVKLLRSPVPGKRSEDVDGEEEEPSDDELVERASR